ncbi:beta-glucan synthesis-associated [Mucidula mucida]|nr:beta-glucan synthesis-associated [Mucidula mucida]
MASSRRGRFDSSTSSLLSSRAQRDSWADSSPYSVVSGVKQSSVADKFSLSADPLAWGTNLEYNVPEPDDALHSPTVRNGVIVDDTALEFTRRGLANLGCLFLLCMAILVLFVGYPILTFVSKQLSTTTTKNLGVNASGQVPEMGNFGLIDLDTPEDVYTFSSWRDGTKWTLVFSDEFEEEGRTFYPGEDPYWEAVDLHYWSTNNLEWYSPEGVTTANGSLKLTLEAKETHGLDYQGGMISTWNKFCFTGGYMEASVQLPGINNIVGLWPAVWAMGNLGRAGYGATLEGTWPYTYDSCDVGTAPNQTVNGAPEAALTSGYESSNYALSYLPGQRLSRCTCPGESHPGPVHSDGTYVGRAAPEIDIFEAQVSNDIGHVSQSGQWAPFNEGYVWNNSSDNLIIADSTISELNSYTGGDYQQSTSVVSETNQDCYQLGTGCFAIYGFEYKPGYDADDAYISWINDGKLAWTFNADGTQADTGVEIAARPVPQEPMYMLANLGMSYNFGSVDLDHITFPAIMLIDYVRVYQHPDRINVGCDPEDYPTADYINTYYDAYINPNYTTWVNDFGQTVPKNSLVDGCD